MGLQCSESYPLAYFMLSFIQLKCIAYERVREHEFINLLVILIQMDTFMQKMAQRIEVEALLI